MTLMSLHSESPHEEGIGVRFGYSSYAPACRRHVAPQSASVSKEQSNALPLFITLSDHMTVGVRRGIRLKLVETFV